MIKNAIVVFAFILIGAGKPASKPNPPKNEKAKDTPAKEDVCNVLKDGTAGLYGLCVAYCEAIDAPNKLLSDADIEALKPAPRNILSNYDKKKKETDPKMPCIDYRNKCIAWSPAEIELVGTLTPANNPNRLDDELVTFGAIARFTDFEYQNLPGAIVTASFVRTLKNATTYSGMFRHLDTANSINFFRNTELTEAEYNDCYKEIDDHNM